MRTRTFGSTDIAVPIIGQGSWNFPAAGAALKETQSSLLTGIEQGMVHIDTAEMYGESEVVIAEAIKNIDRAKLFIVSKVLPSNGGYQNTIKACEKSLKRLGTDYLDCYLLHWRGSIALSETMGAMEKLVADGKIRSLGVSNFDVDDLQEAQSSLTKEKIACNQVLYNLYSRGIERHLLPYCRKNNIALVGYTPFAQKSTPAIGTKSGTVLNSIAQKHKVTPEQVILAFLVRGENLFTIPKASKEAHTRQNAAAGDLILSQEEIDLIDQTFPTPTKDGPLAMI